MTDADDEFDPTAREEREIGREMVDESTGLGSVMAHAYRGEMSRVTMWRGRLDQTTTWAVTVIAALLTWAFSAADNPHYLLLIGVVVVAVFVGVEARRYRDYDVYRSRVRLLQQNLLANALDPSRGVELRDWRRELGEDYRRPALKVSLGEALANRLRRVYLPLFGILLAAWVFRITAFAPQRDWITAAGVGAIPGSAVVGTVALFYAGVTAVALWPRERRAKGEFREADPGTWKDGDDDE